MPGIFVRQELVALDRLHEHEQVRAERLAELTQDIMLRGILERPIVVDVASNVIIDGHHRYNVFKNLGLKAIPVIYADYQNDSIVILNSVVTKQQVVASGRNGHKFPPKTTLHQVKTANGLVAISELVGKISYRVHLPANGAKPL
ncbi:MAG: ParB N-terminal domain-containing protein [Candidatus Aenigmarchaeota archaeon]|nr:ParB N-terminal domain-containing protein [Candidatus Aenigmarchaeota archaeon]